MTIDKDIENLFHEDGINEILAQIVEDQPKIESLVLVYQLKGDKKHDGDIKVFTSEGTSLSDANLLLDLGKTALIEDYRYGTEDEQ